MWAGPCSGLGRTTQSSSSTVETWTPSDRSAVAISSVSRARKGWRRVLGPLAIAASTSARAVMDLDPGSRTVCRTGRWAVGATHSPPEWTVGAASGGTTMSGTPPLCRSTGAALRCRYRCRMCGRYASTRSAADLATLFDALDDTDGELVADYNIAPPDPAAIVRLSTRAAGRVVTVARWGLVPPWSRDRTGAARMINARSETVATSR